MMKALIVGVIFLSGLAYGANEYKQPNDAIFYKTVKVPKLNTPGIVTNASSGQLGSTSVVPVTNGGTNSSVPLNNNRFMVSSGGTIGEMTPLGASLVMQTNSLGLPAASSVSSTTLGFLDATSSVQTQLNSKQSTLTLPLSVSNGGTNTSVALNNNRLMVSSGGTIGEMTPLGANFAMQTNSNGLPAASSVSSTTLGFLDATSSVQTQLNGKQASLSLPLSIANGGNNSSIALNNNRFMVSSGGTIGESNPLSANSVVQTNANGLPSSSSVSSTTLGFLDATSSVQTQLNGKQSTIGTLPIVNGGTNSNIALNNNRILVSNAGTMGELSLPGVSGQILTSNGVALPTWQNETPNLANATGTLAIAKGGTNSTITLNNNRVVVTNAGTMAELSLPGVSGQILTSNGVALPTWQNETPNLANATGTLAIAKGGTNSTIALNNNRILVTSGGTMAELSLTGSSGQLLTSNGPGTLPTWNTSALSTPVIIANGGTNSTIALNNNRIMVSSGGTIGELSLGGTTGQVLTANTGGKPTWNTPSSSPRNEVYYTGANGNGSTNTSVIRWTTAVTTSSGITVVQDSANGDSFTINTAGLYVITVCSLPTATAYLAATKNSTAGGTSGNNPICLIHSSTVLEAECCTGSLTAAGGEVIRGTWSSASVTSVDAGNYSFIRITQVSN